MAENSKIEWCHHTGNMWWGCVEAHEGCDHCYARTFDKRVGGDHWGAKQPRRAVAGVWNEFKKWQKKAAEAGEVHLVFVGSMMDIFERSQPCVDYYGNPLEVTTGELRQRFFDEVVPNSPNLLFLLLTKRPQNITKMVPAAWLENPPTNVMYGTSVVNQATADRNIPALLQVPGRRFLSMEPLLGPVDLTRISTYLWRSAEYVNALTGDLYDIFGVKVGSLQDKIGWAIVGGESGHHARPMHPDWARDIRDQCVAVGVPFLFKQWGEWKPGIVRDLYNPITAFTYRDKQGVFPNGQEMRKVGKHAAGRLLDGRTWDQFLQ